MPDLTAAGGAVCGGCFALVSFPQWRSFIAAALAPLRNDIVAAPPAELAG